MISNLNIKNNSESIEFDNKYLPWVEKYRPNNIDEIISHDQNIETIKQLLLHESLPHLLFYGFPGTGKTSTIMALAKQIYGNNIKLMVMKLDASDDRGINSVREDIKGFAEKSNMFIKGVRLIILDEVDSMTFDAQFALRRIIEKYSLFIRFCLICNYENKIISAIRSRCANFRFSNIEIKYIHKKLEQIAIAENIIIDNNIINTIAYLSKGDLRKAINLFQSIMMQSTEITQDMCYEMTGTPNKLELTQILTTLLDHTHDFDKSYSIINNLFILKGYSLSILLKELLLLIIEDSNNLNKSLNYISEISNLENMIAKSTFSDIYISFFVGIFKKKIEQE